MIKILILIVILFSCATLPTATLYSVNYSTMDGVSNNVIFVYYSIVGGKLTGKTVDYKEITVHNVIINSVEKTTVVKNY